MVLGDTINKASFFKRLLYVPLVVGMAFLSGCGGDSNPSTPPGRGNNGGGNDPVEDNGRTNNEGELELRVGSQDFDVFVEDESGNGLNNIDVKGCGYGGDIYGFLFEDFNGNYFSDVAYIDINDLSSIDNEDGRRISLNETLSKFFRTGDYKKEVHHEPYPYDLSQNRNLPFMETIPIDELYDFYVENDAIFKNMSVLEFVANIPGASEWLSFASEAAKFRQTFIENLNNYNDIVDDFVSLFGGSFEKEAYYIDVYENNLNVLTHQTSTRERYATAKGNVSDENNNRLQGACVEIINGPTRGSTQTDANGQYFLKRLREGNYEFRVTASGFSENEQSKFIIFNGYTQPRCNTFNFYLEKEQNLETLTLQPGPEEGKDTNIFYTLLWGEIQHTDENCGDFGNILLGYYDSENFDFERRGLIQFVNIPYNKVIENAEFEMYGGASFGGATLQIKRIIQPWNEMDVTWNNQPKFDPFVYDSQIVLIGNDKWITFNITDLVDKWSNGDFMNYGLMITPTHDNPNQSCGYWTSDYMDDPQFRPKLKITCRD